MPIYEYICKDCGATIDILQDGTTTPKRCGFRCVIPPHDQREIRGMGTLSRVLSSFSSRTGAQMREVPNAQDIAKSGFTLYKNEGDGTISKIAGSGPKSIDTGIPSKK